jgi:hypothetical protein
MIQKKTLAGNEVWYSDRTNEKIISIMYMISTGQEPALYTKASKSVKPCGSSYIVFLSHIHMSAAQLSYF